MATVIDALVVTLGLDPSQYKAGSKQARADLKKTSDEATRAAKEMEARGKQAAQFFAKIRNEALTMLAVFTAGMGLKDFAVHTITTTASLGRMAANLKMSTQDLAEWQLAAKHAGGSAEGMTAQLKESALAVQKYKMGMPDESTQWFFRYGGNAKALKDGNSYLLARADIVAKLYKQDPTKAMLAASQMGISDEQFNLIKQGSAGIKKALQAQAAAAKEQAAMAKPAEELRKKWDNLSNTFTALGTKILLKLMPHFERLADWIDKNKDKISDFVDRLATAIEKMASWADKAAQSVGGWVHVLTALIALKILGTIANLFNLAKAFQAVAAAKSAAAAAEGGKSSGGAGGAAANAAQAAEAAGKNAVKKGLLGRLVGLINPIGDLYAAWETGQAVGGAIYDHLGEKTRDTIGQYVAEGMEAFGSKEAHEALEAHRKPMRDLVNFFMSKGWTRAQAAGIVANMVRESNLNAHAVGDHGHAYGLGQWHEDRQADFKRWAGKDIRQATDMEQAAFYNYELTQGKERQAGALLRQARTAGDAAEIVSRHDERPADANGEARKRRAISDAVYAAASQGNSLAAAQLASNAQTTSITHHHQVTTNHSSSEMHIGAVHVHTKATDANGIAQSIWPALNQYDFVAQANTGQV